MNKTKKNLIIVAIIFSFVDLGWQIYNIVRYFMTAPAVREPVFYVILDFLTIAMYIAVAVLLILSIWKNGVLFRKRYGLYMTALVLSIIIYLLSITTIMLIATMFISDWVWEKPKEEKNETIIEIVKESDRENKIAELRKKRDNGEITEEEFQEKLIELL